MYKIKVIKYNLLTEQRIIKSSQGNICMIVICYKLHDIISNISQLCDVYDKSEWCLTIYSITYKHGIL